MPSNNRDYNVRCRHRAGPSKERPATRNDRFVPVDDRVSTPFVDALPTPLRAASTLSSC